MGISNLQPLLIWDSGSEAFIMNFLLKALQSAASTWIVQFAHARVLNTMMQSFKTI